MKPYHNLSNIERAELLLDLFPEEVPHLYVFTKEISEMIISDTDRYKLNAVNLLHSTDLWLSLARSANERLKQLGDSLIINSQLFAEQLYEGTNFLFAYHCLHNYITCGKCFNKQFIRTAELLFFFR